MCIYLNRYLNGTYVSGTLLSTVQFLLYIYIYIFPITILEVDNVIIPILQLRKLEHNNLRNLPTSPSHKSGIL